MPRSAPSRPLPPFPGPFDRGRVAAQPALPVFTMRSGAPPAVARPASASAAKPPLQCTSAPGPICRRTASVTANVGNGGALAGCLYPVWMRAVAERGAVLLY